MATIAADERQDVMGRLFELTSDAVVLLRDGDVQGWNAAAEQLTGVPASAATSGAPTGLEPHLAALLELDELAPPQRRTLPPFGTVEVRRRTVAGMDVLLLRDVSELVRREQGQRRLAEVALLLGESRSLAATLQVLATEAKLLTGADFSALLLLREGSTTESSHFVYDAPRHLFPARMPRAVGLLAVPIAAGGPARLDDIRGHPAGVGLPGVHPPIGPLLAVPLLADGAVLGEVAVASSPHGRRFDELDTALLSELAAMVVVAVQRAQATQEQRSAGRRRQQAVDTARHELRTPLGAGKGYASLLAGRLDRLSPEQVATAVAGLQVCFARIEAFSARLLGEQDEPGSAGPRSWSRVAVGPLLEQVRCDAAAITGREQAVVVVQQEQAPTELRGDPEQVRAVLDALVGNALTHAGDAGPVTVTVRAEGEHVRLDVRDHGPGLAQDEQARLLSDADGEPARAGSGLAIVQRLVRAHGGLVGVSSRPGEGATFWVTFPTTVPVDAAGAA